MSYTQEQIDRANQVDLEQFLRSHGEQVTKSGNEYRWKRHDSLTIKGNKWFRHSQSKGGYPVEFVMEFFGKTFPEAVSLLIGEAPAHNGAAAAPSADFRLPPGNRYVARAMTYLRQRNIPEELVQEFYKEGLIYEDARHHNIVFVGKDEIGIPRYAHCKGTEGSFRMDVQGSDKAHNFAYRSDGKSLFVFEAPIDLMSFIALYPNDWKMRNYLSLGGVGAKALEGFLSERKDMETVYICTDSDKAGNDAVNRLLESIPEYMTVIRLTPCEKDWNEVLKQKDKLPDGKYISRRIMLRGESEKKAVPMIRMSEVQQTEVEWLWYPYIPFGKLTIIQGNPGEGKTFFAMQLAAACTNRRFLPQMEPFEPFNMIFQTAEDGLGDTVKPRLLSAEADLERVLVIDDADNPLTLADERIENAIRENHARLVIIDPLQAFLGANVDMNRANEVRPIFRRLADVAQATNCAIVMIGHLNKAAGSQSTYRGLGSIDITAVVRSLLFIGKVKSDPTTRVIVHEKSSLAPPGQSLAFSLGDEKGFRWIGAYDINAEDLLAGGEGSKTELKQEQAAKLIEQFLSEGRKVSIAEINKEAVERGISERTVRLARNSMGDKIASERQGKDWWIWFKQ
ncbi:AAA family ATPase [[Ruminococcus] torques]|uniref:AAA family ATPase n=1 Tax=[Ruminococcus] torques TaxID=33039 RepID=UPI0025A3D5DD|nr:AAA family ATPase [[Ruminococcus] torques]MDM8235610.1 AAA family ATPase [[Ruminococcus] torques]